MLYLLTLPFQLVTTGSFLEQVCRYISRSLLLCVDKAWFVVGINRTDGRDRDPRGACRSDVLGAPRERRR